MNSSTEPGIFGQNKQNNETHINVMRVIICYIIKCLKYWNNLKKLYVHKKMVNIGYKK